MALVQWCCGASYFLAKTLSPTMNRKVKNPDAFKPQPMLRKIPVAGLQGRARFVWGSHQNKARPRSNLAVTITSSLDLAVIDAAIRTMEALRLPEVYRAKRRLAAIGAGDFYREEDFIGGVAYIV